MEADTLLVLEKARDYYLSIGKEWIEPIIPKEYSKKIQLIILIDLFKKLLVSVSIPIFSTIYSINNKRKIQSKELIELLKQWLNKATATKDITNDNIPTDNIPADNIPADNIPAEEIIKLYNIYGIKELLNLGNINIRELKKSILKYDGEYEPETRYWTRQVSKGGVYNLDLLMNKNKLVKSPTSGIDADVIRRYTTINLNNSPALYAPLNTKELPMGSTIAVYNATLEKMILDNMKPCATFQINRPKNVLFQLTHYMNYESYNHANNLDDLLRIILNDVYDIIHKVLNINNPLVKNTRELMYGNFNMIYGTTLIVFKAIRKELFKHDDLKNQFGIKDNSFLVGTIKRSIEIALQNVNVNKYMMDIEQSICI